MATEMPKTSVDAVSDVVSWGAHFCLFYETKEDLLDALISYCKSGLESDEYCLWIVAEPITVEEARDALRDAVPDLDRYLADSRLEIVSARDFFLQGGTFDSNRVKDAMFTKLADVFARGFAGVRVTGDTTWLTKKDWTHFCQIEAAVNEAISDQRLAVLCTYPLATCGAFEILDTVRNHHFALARRYGSWEVIETAALKQTKAELNRLNEKLEQRVLERTNELMQASEALHQAERELKHVNRLTAMGQLAASIIHELNQPLTGVITGAATGLRWLEHKPPDVEEARQALGRISRDGNRAGDVIGRIRALIRREPPRNDDVEINKVILDVISLTRGEVMKNGVSVQTQLGEGLPLIKGDRVQLQQVILNLILNAVQAMSSVTERTRELLISTEQQASDAVLVTVQDSGPGFKPESFDRLFDAFYTTKAEGMGMGLSICRSIVDAHGGRIWASLTAGLGAIVQFTL